MSHSQTSPRGYITVTVIAAITASLAAASALAFSLPVWAMFVGWIAFFTRGLTTRSTIENLGCVWLGLGVGSAGCAHHRRSGTCTGRIDGAASGRVRGRVDRGRASRATGPEQPSGLLSRPRGLVCSAPRTVARERCPPGGCWDDRVRCGLDLPLHPAPSAQDCLSGASHGVFATPWVFLRIEILSCPSAASHPVSFLP